MALPKRRHSTQRSGKRRAAITRKAPAVTFCPNCHQKILPHRVCPNCGQYKGREILKFKDKKKKSKKAKNENQV